MTQLPLELLPLELLGAREIVEGVVYFGIILPPTTDGRSALDGYHLWVRVIHEEDQFLKSKKPIEAQLNPGSLSEAACFVYEEINGRSPNSAVQAYSCLRNPVCEDLSYEPQYVQSLLNYQPSRDCKDQPFFWYCTLDLKAREPASRDWNRENLYVYRFFLRKTPEEGDGEYIVEREIDWITDPFAREFGKGKLSAFTCGCKKYLWKADEKQWSVPALNDLIMYEMMLDEFNEDIDGAIEKIPYLADLGINCISLMPVTNVDIIVDWGYTPIGYFGIDERFGKESQKKFKRLIEVAHENCIALVFDAVYAHTSPLFCYYALYERIFIDNHIAKRQKDECANDDAESKQKIKEEYRDANKRSDTYSYEGNPFMGVFSRTEFGNYVDFNKKFTEDFFFTVSYYWLDEFHVDGFRYDYVPGYYFPKMPNPALQGQIDTSPDTVNKGFKKLVKAVYVLIEQAKAKLEGSLPVNYVERFSDADNVIQAAEYLADPTEILNETYANCNWQTQTLEAAKKVAHRDNNYMQELGHKIGLSGEMKFSQKTQLQYIENHDVQRFVCNFGDMHNREKDKYEVFREGDRNQCGYKVQPYLIALLTSKGIPLLWQGQEFCENNYVDPDGGAYGLGRIRMFRPIRWDYFYDDLGQATISLIRRLTRIRHKREEFRSLSPTTYYFHNEPTLYQNQGVLVYYRFKSHQGQPTEPFSIVMLNFTDQKQEVNFQFPRNPGDGLRFPENYSNRFVEELTLEACLLRKEAGLDGQMPASEELHDGKQITIDSNYGCIWSTSSAV